MRMIALLFISTCNEGQHYLVTKKSPFPLIQLNGNDDF